MHCWQIWLACLTDIKKKIDIEFSTLGSLDGAWLGFGTPPINLCGWHFGGYLSSFVCKAEISSVSSSKNFWKTARENMCEKSKLRENSLRRSCLDWIEKKKQTWVGFSPGRVKHFVVFIHLMELICQISVAKLRFWYLLSLHNWMEKSNYSRQELAFQCSQGERSHNEEWLISRVVHQNDDLIPKEKIAQCDLWLWLVFEMHQIGCP